MARPGAPLLDPSLVARTRPTSDLRDHLLPVAAELRALLPGGGLRRGTLVAVEADPEPGGALTLAFSLVAAATVAESWAAAVGVTDLGVLALAELGADLGHLVLVPRPGPRWPEVAAAFLGAVDVVVLRPPTPVRPAAARRLAARARERRTALVLLPRPSGTAGRAPAPWPEGPDLRLRVTDAHWQGVGRGHGHLRGRRVVVEASGRRGAARPVRVELWLPGPTGAPTPGG